MSDMLARLKRWLARTKRWYKGEWKPFQTDPNSPVVGVGLHRHWTARVAHGLVAFWLSNWKWIITTAIALVGLWVALSRL